MSYARTAVSAQNAPSRVVKGDPLWVEVFNNKMLREFPPSDRLRALFTEEFLREQLVYPVEMPGLENLILVVYALDNGPDKGFDRVYAVINWVDATPLRYVIGQAPVGMSAEEVGEALELHANKFS
jgi:hypothetical protein